MTKDEIMGTTAVLHSFPARKAPHATYMPENCPHRAGHASATCQTCGLRELCLPAGLELQEIDQLNAIINRKRPLKRGEYLYRTGGTLPSIYAVRTGFLKSCVLHDDGREQVAGFHMMGELLGLDAIGSGMHMCDAVALEDSEVCEIPFNDLERLGREIPALQQHFHRIMSRELTQDQRHLLSLGTMRAEERLAAFLLSLSQRLAARGYLNNEFDLRMSRVDIGSYLGIQIETVSRMLSRFAESGLIQIKQRHIKLIDMNGLYELAGIPNPDRTTCVSADIPVKQA